MSDLLRRLKRATSKAVESKTLADSDYFDYKKYGAPVDPLVFNLALSGDLLEGGLTPGVTVLSGQSKTFKTAFGINAVGAYLRKYPDAVCIFYDSELGAPGYWKMAGVDENRVIHVVIQNLEHLKFDFQKKLNEIKDGEHVIIFIDSIGMLASKKEVADALREHSAADMTRAKEIKAFFRQITPHANELHIPVVAINNNYAGMGGKYAPDEVMGGGGGILLAANNVLWFRKRKFRDGSSEGAVDGDLAGHDFVITVNKSRFIKEGTKFVFRMLYGEQKPNRYTGLYQLACKTGDIYSPSRGWRAARLVNPETKKALPKEQHVKFRESEAFTDEDFWESVMFEQTNFVRNIRKRVSLYFEDDGIEDSVRVAEDTFDAEEGGIDEGEE